MKRSKKDTLISIVILLVFFIQLKRLEDASRDEVEDIRPLVAGIVPTYVYNKEEM